MRIAIFDHQLNYGGGKRFLINLMSAMAQVDKSVQITLFCSLKAANDSFDLEELRKSGISVRPLKSLENIYLKKRGIPERIWRYFLRQIRLDRLTNSNMQDELSNEISAISNDYDVAYFPWPFLLKSPTTSCPKVATFHDFNFKYFFGTPIYNQEQLAFLNTSMSEWMKDTVPVVSTHFMKSELLHFYPDVKKVNVIHLASLNAYTDDQELPDHLFDFKYLLDKPFIVFPVHVTPHKNIGNVIAATSLVNKDEVKFRLILTGNTTDTLKGKSSYLGLVNENSADADIIGLGYISDKQMFYLQQKSFAVLNSSFYEAGNGVGLDAWPLGVPVIQSNIPAFEEHLNLQGFKAFTFDPRDVYSISQAIEDCLNNIEKRDMYVKESLYASNQLNWGTTATKYLEVLRTVAKNQTDAN